jgi:hypothetical protein
MSEFNVSVDFKWDGDVKVAQRAKLKIGGQVIVELDAESAQTLIDTCAGKRVVLSSYNSSDVTSTNFYTPPNQTTYMGSNNDN